MPELVDQSVVKRFEQLERIDERRFMKRVYRVEVNESRRRGAHKRKWADRAEGAIEQKDLSFQRVKGKQEMRGH